MSRNIMEILFSAHLSVLSFFPLALNHTAAYQGPTVNRLASASFVVGVVSNKIVPGIIIATLYTGYNNF